MKSKRWLILGHWRKLPSGKRIWIEPKVKGPEPKEDK